MSAPADACDIVGADALRTFAAGVFAAAGLPPADARVVADALVWADLRGVDSHGVIRIPGYLDYLKSGRMNPRPRIRSTSERSATLVVDADRAVGAVATVYAMDQAMAKARGSGIGWAVVRGLTHQGALGQYARIAADAGMVGLVCTVGTPVMAAHGARVRALHNAPIALSVPAGRHPSLLLDMAQSVAAGGRIKHAQDSGVAIPPTWAMDPAGSPTTDPARALALLPLGGHKGSGMAMIWECLASIMAGNPILASAIPAMLAGGERDHAQNGVVAAIDVEAFTSLPEFLADVDRTIDAIKMLPPAAGHDEVLVPGESGDRTMAIRAARGIPVTRATTRRLERIAASLRIPAPAAFRKDDHRQETS